MKYNIDAWEHFEMQYLYKKNVKIPVCQNFYCDNTVAIFPYDIIDWKTF